MELINNFIGLQDKFRIRTEKYESGSTRTVKTARSKNSKKGDASEKSKEIDYGIGTITTISSPR